MELVHVERSLLSALYSFSENSNEERLAKSQLLSKLLRVFLSASHNVERTLLILGLHDHHEVLKCSKRKTRDLVRRVIVKLKIAVSDPGNVPGRVLNGQSTDYSNDAVPGQHQ